MTKCFSPVRIQNPTSLLHLVHVHPGQKILLSLDSDQFRDAKVDVSPGYLGLDSMIKSGSEAIYTISHLDFVHHWSHYSNVLLGEVWIDSNTSMAKLMVVMDCSTPAKSSHITVINPDCVNLRVRPYHVLEIVAYDKEFNYQDNWRVDWLPRPINDRSVEIEQIGYDYCGLHAGVYHNREQPEYLYAKFPRERVTSGWPRQHHFWFRFTESVLPVLVENSGIVQIGDFLVRGISSKFQPLSATSTTYQMSVFLDCRKNDLIRTQQTLNLKTKSAMPVITTSVLSQTAVVQAKAPPSIRDVDIEQINFASIEQGCKVLSSEPPNWAFGMLGNLANWACFPEWD